jgi:hypothetical protein
MPTPETTLLRACERELKNRHIAFRKRHGTAMGVTGDPDLYFCVNGRHCEVELKRPGNNPTPLQTERLAEWGRAGASTAVVHTPEELREFLAKLYT